MGHFFNRHFILCVGAAVFLAGCKDQTSKPITAAAALPEPSPLASVAPASVSSRQPLPVKINLRVKEADAKGPLFDSLTKPEKQLAYHLQAAARAGRILLFVQSHRHSVALKRILESSVASPNFTATEQIILNAGGNADSVKEWLAYAALFEEDGGPYTPANLKYIISKSSSETVKKILKANSVAGDEAFLDEMVKLLADPTYEVIRVPESPDGSDLNLTGGNLYESGISGQEVADAVKAGLDVKLNCLVVRDPTTRKLTCNKLTAKSPGVVGQALTEVVKHLKLAEPLALSDNQRDEIRYLVKYFEEGDVEDFRQSSIAWVKDRDHSKVDFTMGFIEVYEDYLGQMGSWESYVQIVDPVTTKISKNLAGNAQYFEDQMPYGVFKKTFPNDYAPPALMVYYWQELAGMRSGGYNLPNFDDIRRDVGFKNIIRLDLPGESDTPAAYASVRESYQAYFPADKIERAIQYKDKSRRVLVLLHEIIGHGSGTYDETKFAPGEDPISALGNLGSSIEEQRADLAALTFSNDPKLIEVGIYSSKIDAENARDAMYDSYLGNFLMRLAKERSLAESHSRGHWLLINRLLKAGAIGWADPDQKPGSPSLDRQVLRVLDYNKFQDVSRSLLAELQNIKATRDVVNLGKIMSEDAPLDAAQSEWAKAIVQRGLNLAYMAGTVEQPWTLSEDLKFSVCGTADLRGIADCLGN